MKLVISASPQDVSFLRLVKGKLLFLDQNVPVKMNYPIHSNGEDIGYIIIDIDPEFIARQFRDVIADLIVVILVAMMLTFEQMVVMMSRSLSVPLERLQTIVALQAAGNFSNRIAVRDKNTIDRLGTVLSQRAETLHKMFAHAIKGSGVRKENCM